MKYFIVSGEKSGDMHAANLVREIKFNDNNAVFEAWGGSHMAAEGVKVLKNYEELAIMGFWEVLKNIFKIRGFFKEAKQQITDFQPDLLILVDYAGFNLRLAAWAKANNFKIVYYIAPKAWAWQKNRAFKLKKYVDMLLVILPFEKKFFESYNINTAYVGNPLLDEIESKRGNQEIKLESGKKIIALLPGSRKQEIENMLRIMHALAKDFAEYKFIVAGVSTLPVELYENLPENVSIVYDKTYALLENSYAAIVTSGTATLETALFNVPQVVVYKTSWLTYFIASLLVKIKYISLVNLIVNDEIVKELIQKAFNVVNLSHELKKITQDHNFREQNLVNYRKLRALVGSEGASKNAAKEISEFLKK